MIKKLIVGNWKLNPQKAAQAKVLASRIERGLKLVHREKVEAVLCPPYPFLSAVKNSIHFASLGAQNVSAEKEGAFTGEVSARQLKESGVSYVIVGHSERREMGEDDDLVNRKIRRVLREGMEPVLCVGFGTKKSHSYTTIEKIVLKQLKKGLDGLGGKSKRVTVAYEPVWAISKGVSSHKPATPEHALAICEFIGKKFKVGRVIYGASVHEKNAKSFAEIGLQGVLPGGASLDFKKFLGIVKAFSK